MVAIHFPIPHTPGPWEFCSNHSPSPECQPNPESDPITEDSLCRDGRAHTGRTGHQPRTWTYQSASKELTSRSSPSHSLYHGCGNAHLPENGVTGHEYLSMPCHQCVGKLCHAYKNVHCTVEYMNVSTCYVFHEWVCI
jgi:hypothetical protein